MAEKFTEANKILRNPPLNIDEYIVYSKFLVKIDDKMVKYGSRFNDLKDLMQLMD
jgi:hypothetical protein